MSNVTSMPIFKKGSTAAEFFYEMHLYALEKPQRFRKMAIVFEEELPNKCTLVRQLSNFCTTSELIGLLELGKHRVIQETEK